MRSWVFVLSCTIAACAQPTLLQCPADHAACTDGCFDLQIDRDHCGGCDVVCANGMTCEQGACVGTSSGVCATNNGGCSPNADCIDQGGSASCACRPGFTGDGTGCTACSVCDPTQFAASLCDPAMDTVCLACSTGCPSDMFEVAPCSPLADLACAPCSVCAPGSFQVGGCVGSQDTACAVCAASCAECSGSSDFCTACAPGFMLVGASCVLACGNGIIDPGEHCDDGNRIAGDGCSPACEVEAGAYCYGEGPSTCHAGSCIFEPATALPLGPDFAIDGAGTASAAGITFSQRSTLHTTADVTYPMMIEADVVYAAPDTTFLGSRGSGLRQAADADEPTDSLRARLSASTVELAAGNTITDSTPTPFTPVFGVRYHVRYVDDGMLASVVWIDTMNPMNGIGLQTMSSYHGGGDRAFVGGGDMAGLTVANIRVCSAPPLPVTAGLTAHYSSIPSWTAVQDAGGHVTSWLDSSGNGHDLAESGPNPALLPQLIAGHTGLDFSGGARFATAPFALTTDVTVFAVIVQRVPDQWGAIAHHGDRDTDWSMEQNGGAPDELHWQTNNDNTNMNLTLVPDTAYILTGRFAGNARYFSSSTLDGAPPDETAIVDASHTITAGSKILYVGASDANEASNAYIGELLYFARALDDTERDQVIDYLRQLWRP
ncbi:MAG: EGF domain-containing protein [Kofleriaceae bacterium]